MRHLLDSHALPWYGLADSRLSGTAKAAILDSTNEILVSPASYWEIAIKVSIGKLILHQPYEDFVDRVRISTALLFSRLSHSIRRR